MSAGFWLFYFGWYQGAVYSNLIASAVCSGAAATVVLWRTRVHLRRHQAARDRQHAKTHRLLERLHEQLDIPMPPEDQT